MPCRNRIDMHIYSICIAPYTNMDAILLSHYQGSFSAGHLACMDDRCTRICCIYLPSIKDFGEKRLSFSSFHLFMYFKMTCLLNVINSELISNTMCYLPKL